MEDALSRLSESMNVLPAFGQMALGDIGPADIQAWVAELSGRLAPASVRRSYTVLVGLLGCRP